MTWMWQARQSPNVQSFAQESRALSITDEGVSPLRHLFATDKEGFISPQERCGLQSIYSKAQDQAVQSLATRLFGHPSYGASILELETYDRLHLLEAKLQSLYHATVTLFEERTDSRALGPSRRDMLTVWLPEREELAYTLRQKGESSSANGHDAKRSFKLLTSSRKDFLWGIMDGESASAPGFHKAAARPKLYLFPDSADKCGGFKAFRAVVELGHLKGARAMLGTFTRVDSPRDSFEKEFAIRSLNLPHTLEIEEEVSQLVEGGEESVCVEKLADSLTTVLRDRGPMNAEEFRLIVRTLIEHLEALHAAGWAHLDLKPSQILVEQNRNGKMIKAYVTDFGLAAKLTSDGAARLGLRGSPGYYAPEWGRRVYAHDAVKIDIFTLGVTLLNVRYGLRRGRKGLLGEQHDRAPVADPAQKVIGWKRTLDPKACLDKADIILLRCVALFPEQRPSLEELKNTLWTALEMEAAPRDGIRSQKAPAKGKEAAIQR